MQLKIAKLVTPSPPVGVAVIRLPFFSHLGYAWTYNSWNPLQGGGSRWAV